MTTVIAQRNLLFSLKGQSLRRPLAIRAYAPVPVPPESPLYRPDQETASCRVEFDGIAAGSLSDTYAADTLQALQLAADVEPIRRRLSKDYDFYFPTGEGYFDE